MDRLPSKLIPILLFATVLVYCNAFRSGYLQWDDNVFIQENLILKLDFLSAVQTVFSRFFFGDYLPITLISFWADIKLFGYDPIAQHSINLLIHLLNVFLLWVFLTNLTKNNNSQNYLAIIVCCFFAIHPMQTEAVLWISERKTLLCIFFSLMGVLSLRGNLVKKEYFKNTAYSIFFGLALLSKTTNIFLPIWLIVIDYVIDKRSWKSIAKRHFFALGLSVAMIIVRLKAYQDSVPNLTSASLDVSRLLQVPVQILNALGIYIKMAFFPVDQTIIYPDYSFDGAVVINIAILLIFCVTASVVWYKKRDPLILVFSSLVILFLAPILQLIPRINYVSERYMYFPIVGIIALTYLVFENVKWKPQFSSAAVLAFVLISATLTFNRSFVWISNNALWADTTKKNPTSALAFLNYGLELEAQLKYALAIENFNKSITLGTNNQIASLAYNNLANIYSNQKLSDYFNINLAVVYYEKAIASNANPYEKMIVMYNLAMVYASRKENQKALELLLLIKEMAQQYSDARFDSLVVRVNGVVNQLER